MAIVTARPDLHNVSLHADLRSDRIADEVDDDSVPPSVRRSSHSGRGGAAGQRPQDGTWAPAQGDATFVLRRATRSGTNGQSTRVVGRSAWPPCCSNVLSRPTASGLAEWDAQAPILVDKIAACRAGGTMGRQRRPASELSPAADRASRERGVLHARQGWVAFATTCATSDRGRRGMGHPTQVASASRLRWAWTC